MELVPCGGCRRHVRATDVACPFCASSIEPSKTARLARAALTAGLAATCSVTLAACYGGPPIHGVDRGPIRWRVDASSEFIGEFSRRAVAAQCRVEEWHGSAVLVSCRAPDAKLGLTPAPGGVYVTCEEGSAADCVAQCDRGGAPAPADGEPGAAPSSSVPPLEPIAPPGGAGP